MNIRIFAVLVLVIAACAGTPPAAEPQPVHVVFETTAGEFVIAAHPEWAPVGAARFLDLVERGYYDDCRFFRVVPGWVVQWGIHGDPEIAARWSEMTMPDDEVKAENRRGTIAFAMTSEPMSRTTQVYVNLADNQAKLDERGFAVFGEVAEGMDVVDRITSVYGQTPDQGMIHAKGNVYLDGAFPRLDHIRRARIRD